MSKYVCPAGYVKRSSFDALNLVPNADVEVSPPSEVSSASLRLIVNRCAHSPDMCAAWISERTLPP